jgi:hypothetical protein
VHAARSFEITWRANLDDQGPELLPYSLARSARDTLQVDGAGICLFGHLLRVPLGASSPEVALAERAQTTLGSGPCLEAIEHETAISASAATLARRWPALSEAFAATPYRSTVSIPIRLSAGLNAALDLYFVTPTLGEDLRMVDATVVARLIRAALLDALAVDEGSDELAMLSTISARRRAQVWTAIGIVMDELHADEVDALARLRAYAYAAGTDLDEVADALVHGRMTARSILADQG